MQLTMEQYQAIPALSAGGAWILSELCPALYWAQSPLNPSRLPTKNTTEFDIGTACHLAILEPHEYAERVFHIPHDSYRTKEARDLRDMAYVGKQTPLKPAEVAIVDGVRDAILRRADVARLFTGGSAETSITWTMDDVPCKCRPDYVSGGTILDLKTVACAHPSVIKRASESHGWFVRDVWYREGVAVGAPHLLPESGALRYWFVCVEKEPPYLIEVYECTERARTAGEKIVGRALRLFRAFREVGRWPGYNQVIPAPLDRPVWAEYAFADREEAGEFRR